MWTTDDESVNILFLGEVGVGKSTFINSLANSLHYETLDFMLNKEPKILIRTDFNFLDENHRSIQILHEPNWAETETEVLGGYKVLIQKYRIPYTDSNGEIGTMNILDTPGIPNEKSEDSGSKSQTNDLVNTLLMSIPQLHSVCVLLKPNQDKFSFWDHIEKLLIGLPPVVLKNINFCVTHASSRFSAGETLNTLRTCLENFEKKTGILIEANNDNLFFVDNNCFRYVLAVKSGMSRCIDESELFTKSWETNVNNAKSLVAKAQAIQNYDAGKIGHTRQLVSILAEPLAEVVRNQLVNMKLADDYAQELRGLTSKEAATLKIEDQLTRRIAVLETQKQTIHFTICKSPKCSTYAQDYQNCFEENRICHRNCVPAEKTCGSEKPCEIFYSNGTYRNTCNVCGCHKSYHSHRFWKTMIREKKLVDYATCAEYQSATVPQEKIACIERLLERRKEEDTILETEYNTVKDFFVDAAIFISESSVQAVADPYLLEIENLIRDEENRSKASGNNGLFYELPTLKTQYEDKVKELQAEIKNNRSAPLVWRQVRRKLNNLTKLLICGEQVRLRKEMCDENILNLKLNQNNDTEPSRTTGERQLKKSEEKSLDRDYNASSPITFTENSKDDRKPGPKNINILLLGETGVGKTTYINSLINSLDHATLDSMLKAGEPKILVDANFTISDKNVKNLRVKFAANYPKRGESTKNERLDSKGESSIQAPIIYRLPINDENETKMLNIIDTPGISDTRGEKMDKANFEKILSSIAELGELHAICIMLKPNQARFTPSFRYNIEGLLKQLHQDAIKNMLFCFKNTRSTLYRPGDTLATLHKYLETLKKEKTTDVLLKADKYNIFCFDNDCFRYVLAVNQGVYQRTAELDLLFSESWERNARESKKLLARAECLPIHNVQDTLEINYTRKLISTLAKPLAEVAKNHLINMRHTDDYMQQIRELDKNKSKVQGQLRRRIAVLVPQKLEKPRTVCKSHKCTTYLRKHNYVEEHKVCHDNCNQEYVPDGVRKCAIFQDNWGYFQARCRVCGCHSDWHIHEFYKNVEQLKTVTDSTTLAELNILADRTALLNLMLEEEKEKYKALEFEHNAIRDFCAEAAVFLLENSIHAGGDPYLIEIENLIRDEEKKYQIGGDSQMLYIDRQMQYQERVAALQEDIKRNRRSPLTSDQLMNMMDNLSGQKMCGEQIKKLKKLCEENIPKYETSKTSETHL